VDFDSYEIIEFNEDCLTVMNTWDIFSKMLLFGKISIFDGRQKIQTNSEKCQCARTRKYIYRRRAKLEFVTLNALSGPIYIGKDAEIMEGSVIRGPLHCVKPWVKTAKVYELHSRTSFQNWRRGKQFISAYSNKGHDGFRNSVLGEWCNIGDSNNSNLKNNYEEETVEL
jgi:hypothetical protein